MFDNGRVWAPRPQTLPVKPAHALLSKGPKQGVEIALKVREKKHTHTETNTHRHTKTCTWTQTSNPPSGCCVRGKGGEPLWHQAANHTCPCSESKVVQHSRHQTVLKLSYLCHPDGGCFVPKKLSMPLCCDRVFHLSSSLYFHLPLSLSQFLHRC